MNISRLNTQSTQTGAAGQVQRNPRLEKPAQIETVLPLTTDTPAATDSTSKGLAHPRLAAYADKIDARLSQALQSPDLTPRQKAALKQAQDHFHSMVQRLDAAYTPANISADKKHTQTMSQGLDMLLDHVAGQVNHIQDGGLDVKG
jgi:hypothetical protein